VACSALLHAAAQQSNLRLAWQLFEAMVACKVNASWVARG
jgi:pentatricopeptide repeat protein